jgi:hypothetical protein
MTAESRINPGAHRDAATGQTGLLPISQAPSGDLYDLWRKQSNFLGIVDEDAVAGVVGWFGYLHNGLILPPPPLPPQMRLSIGSTPQAAARSMLCKPQ